MKKVDFSKIKQEDIIKRLMLKHKGKTGFNLEWNLKAKEWDIILQK